MISLGDEYNTMQLKIFTSHISKYCRAMICLLQCSYIEFILFKRPKLILKLSYSYFQVFIPFPDHPYLQIDTPDLWFSTTVVSKVKGKGFIIIILKRKIT